jgi:predicted enzyme related to lactoylglutathione lyase
MNFGYTILYVDDVAKTLAFYERAFGLKTKMTMGNYGELDTGATTLSFAERALATEHVGMEPQKNGPAPFPLEIAFTTKDVASAYDAAIKAGCVSVAAPSQKPWGQTISYVRDCNGFLVEICSPMS